MFKKLKYLYRSKNYFRPHEEKVVDVYDFMKILKGGVFNPVSKELNSKKYADYSYMVVGVSENSPLNSWAGQQFGVNGYWNAHEGAEWYGKFTCERNSRIIIPEKFEIDFNPFSKNSLGNFNVLSSRGQPWLGGGFMQVDKDLHSRTLVSDLTLVDLRDCINLVFGKGSLRLN